MRRIDSPNDESLDPFRAIKDRHRRADGGRFVVESPRCVSRFLDAVKAGWFQVETVLGDPGRSASEMKVANELGATVLSADETIMTEASGYHFHAGCLAIGIRPARPADDEALMKRLLERDRPRILLLAMAGITSMDNMGGIFRSTAALGADGLLLDHACADPLLRRCIRISMGQVFRVDWASTPSLPTALARLRSDHGFKAVALENLPEAPLLSALSRTPGTDRIDDRIPERVVVVVGNEGHGLGPEVLEACDTTRRIEGPASLPDEEQPGAEDERSLNAATAAAIAMHHLLHA